MKLIVNCEMIHIEIDWGHAWNVYLICEIPCIILMIIIIDKLYCQTS